MKNNNIAKKIKDLRILKGLSQEKLAELAQISLRTVQRIENSETEPRGHSLQQIAAALETTPQELNATVETNNDVPYTKSDKSYLTLLHLSALSFMLFPLLGILIPFIIWMIKRGQIPGINKVAKRVLLYQSIWCLLLGYLYSVLLFHMPFFTLGYLGGVDMMLISICVLYLGNIVLILVNAFKNSSNKQVTYHSQMAV